MTARDLFLVFLLLQTTVVSAATQLIYREKSIGSDSTFNPLSQYLNLAFDTTQNPYYFSQSNYFSNHAVLWQRVRNPFQTIEENGGYGEFVKSEIFGIRAAPNYTLHLIGGGYDYRWLAEWYEARKVPYPYAIAFLTSYLANIGNEALETTAKEVPPTDNVADLFIFDIAGKLLFMNDSVVEFFHDKAKLRAWHFQPMLDLRTLQIVNSGCNYILRPEFFGREYRPFFFVGMTQMVGLSVLVSGQDALTGALGIALTDPLIVKGDFVGALFWDKEDALMASVIFNGSSNLAVRVNVYPDVFEVFGLRTGVYSAITKDSAFMLGINLSLPAGFAGST